MPGRPNPDFGDQKSRKESMDYCAWVEKEEKLKRDKDLKKRYHNLKSVDLDLEEEDMNDIRKALLKRYNVKANREDIYEDIYCELALFVFSKKNPFRIFCARIASHAYFETVVITIIILSSLKLVIDTYESPYWNQDFVTVYGC